MDFGGTERNIAYLLNRSSEHHEYTLVLLNNETISFNIPESVKLIYLNDDLGIIQLLKIVILTRRNEFDYIFSFLTYPIFLSLVVKIISNVKLVINERSNPNLIYSHSRVKHISYFLYRRFLFRFADYITVNSMGAFLYYKTFLNASKIIYVTNYPGEPSEFKRNEASSGFITVGRLDKFKNHAFQINAFKEFSDLGYNLDIFGQGSERENLENLITSLSLQGAVKIHKPTGKISENLFKYRIFLYSSKVEGSPNVLSEASLHQVPIVTTYFEYGIDEIFRYKLGFDSKFNFQVYDNGIVVYSQRISDYKEAINYALKYYEIFYRIDKKFNKESGRQSGTINNYYLESLLEI